MNLFQIQRLIWEMSEQIEKPEKALSQSEKKASKFEPKQEEKKRKRKNI